MSRFKFGNKVEVKFDTPTVVKGMRGKVTDVFLGGCHVITKHGHKFYIKDEDLKRIYRKSLLPSGKSCR